MSNPRWGMGPHAAPDGAWLLGCNRAIDMALLTELSRNGLFPNSPSVSNTRDKLPQFPTPTRLKNGDAPAALLPAQAPAVSAPGRGRTEHSGMDWG
jgi:hypothetical protein